MVDRSDNEILEGWSTSDLKSLPTFESVVPRNLPKVSVQTVLNSPDAYSLIIDVRSEKEFEESHLPGALSFPILNNEERHEVGLLYKNLGRPQAVQRALNAAVPKLSNLEKLLQKQVRNAGPVLLYCWRGGGRSAYTQNQILKMGFEAFSLDGGHKSYRKEVYETLYNRKGPRFLVLKGLTGVGKTDLLHAVNDELRVMDLELYARHCSSSFGSIPYERVKDFAMTQKHFEDQIYHSLKLSNTPIASAGILCESESRRIGKLMIPPAIFEAMLSSPTIEITASLESRVERIFKEYIGQDHEGLPLLKRDLKRIKKYLSKANYQRYIDLLDQGQIHELLAELLENYYDTRYSGIYQAPTTSIDSTNLKTAKEKLMEILARGTRELSELKEASE